MSIVDFRHRKVEKLNDQGYACIRDGEHARALEIAAELEALRYTSAFEIAAMAHAELGDIEEAVRVLERGVDKAPSAWVNWQLLGNYRSDLERYEDASAAYEQALRCPDVDKSSIRLNQAILASRRGLDEEALVYLDQVTDPTPRLRAASARVGALAGLGRLDEAIGHGQSTLAEAQDELSEDHSFLAAAIARARLKRGDTAADIFAFALAALEDYERSNRSLLAVIRDADNAYSLEAKYYRMTIDAKIPFTEPRYREHKGYIVNYDVVADSVAEALRYVARMEDPVVRGNLALLEHEILEDRPNEPKGVYFRTARHYYAVDE